MVFQKDVIDEIDYSVLVLFFKNRMWFEVVAHYVIRKNETEELKR